MPKITRWNMYRSLVKLQVWIKHSKNKNVPTKSAVWYMPMASDNYPMTMPQKLCNGYRVYLQSVTKAKDVMMKNGKNIALKHLVLSVIVSVLVRGKTILGWHWH